MLKHYLKGGLLLAWSAIFLGCAFVACDDDDDDNGSASSSLLGEDAGTITVVGNTSYRLTCVGYTDFVYSETGELVRVDDYDVTNNPFTLVDEDEYGEDEYEKETLSNFRFNGSGYITSYTEDYSYNYSYGTEEGKTNVSFAYNGDGQITKIVAKGNSTEVEDGEKYSCSGTRTVVFTYQNGNLIKVVDSSDYTDGYKETGTFEYEYDGEENQYGQYTYAYVENFDFVGFDLAYIGLFGKASKQLPCKFSEKWVESEDGEEYVWQDSGTISYSKNSDGLIYYEDYNGSRIYYTYGTETKAAVESVIVPNENRPQLRHFGLRHRARHQK